MRPPVLPKAHRYRAAANHPPPSGPMLRGLIVGLPIGLALWALLVWAVR